MEHTGFSPGTESLNCNFPGVKKRIVGRSLSENEEINLNYQMGRFRKEGPFGLDALTLAFPLIGHSTCSKRQDMMCCSTFELGFFLMDSK